MVTSQTSNDLGNTSVHIWRIDLNGSVGNLSALLSAQEIKRADDKKAEIERSRFIRARGAMRSILGDYLALPGGELEFVLGEKGKPSIDHPDSNLEFNLTHCDEMALLAVSEATPVGIDLERIRTRTAQLKIAKRMFSESVYRELEQLSSDQLAPAFFKHWTELEARAKCVGDGIFSHDSREDEIISRHFSPQDGWIACIATCGISPAPLVLKHFLYEN
jgi:4'-phosphopantetheinyl transferase